jgi:hypothetical protein
MDRLISERAVIDSIEFFQMNPQHFDFVNLIDDIKEIPSAEPKRIPVSGNIMTLINKITPAEISMHIANGDLNQWCNKMQTELTNAIESNHT